jgi:protein involved in polysaccharide export with SLBB domain
MTASILRPTAVLAGLLFLAGCATPPAKPVATFAPVAPADVESVPATPLDPALLNPPTEPFTLGPGDRIAIEILGDPATHAEVTVGPDGKIYYYLLPGLDVWGLSLGQARQRLAGELRRYLRLAPSVAVTLRRVQSKQVWILGRVNHPGVYPLAGPTTLLEALSEAGGPSSASAVASLSGALGISAIGSASEAADLSRSFLIRQGRVVPVNFERLLREGDLSQNLYLQPDDFIYLPSSGIPVVYVLGAVLQPRAVNFSGRPTLIQTIASAGGTIKDAYLSQVAIVRGSLAEPAMALVDYHAIARGKAPDVALQPGDIVYVPYTPYRTPLRYANLILDTFARTMGVNEGAHAVTNSGASVGVNVSLGP